MQLTADEMTFMQRMLPHFMAGKTAAEAAAAVLEDDQRLVAAVMKHSDHKRTADERAHIRSEMARIVYRKLREAA